MAEILPSLSRIAPVTSPGASVVLFLVGVRRIGGRPEPCLILNKRSRYVIQPGDLCCPGGGITPKLDQALARLLKLGKTPLTRWAGWNRMIREHSREAETLSVLFATALREGVEEMRLNPLGVRFLGMLPVQSLVLLNRTIFPIVCQLGRQTRFFPNWEVERIVTVPLRSLLEPDRYALYRVRVRSGKTGRSGSWVDFPCFVHDGRKGRELLWGATFRMTLDFLFRVFDFRMPDAGTLPVFFGSLDRSYLKGGRR